MATPKKVKLGPKAGSFFDAVTRLKVGPNQVIKATAQQTKSEKFQKAIAHRWLIETDEEETKTKEPAVEADTVGDTSNFTKKTIPQLIEYIEDNYEIDEEEMEKVRKMKKDDLVAYVEKLEEEDEE